MSVVWCRPIADGREVELDERATTRTRQWKIQTSVKTDNEATILASGLLPALYEPDPDNSYRTARRIVISQIDDTCLAWIATVTYSSESLTGGTQDDDKVKELNPIDRRAKIRWNSAQYTKVFDKDTSGNAVVNSAGDPFDPPVEIESSRWQVTIQKNVSAVPTYVLTYQDAINSDSFTLQGITVAVRCARVTHIEISDLQKENDIEFYTFTYSMEFNKDTWRKKVPDMGYRKLVGGVPTDILLPDENGNLARTSVPRQLDGSGGVIANPTASTVIYKEFQGFAELPFSGVLPMS